MAGAEHAPRTSKALFLFVFSSHHIVSTPSYFASLLQRQRICYGGGGTRIEQLQRVVFVCVQLPPYSFQCPQCLLLIHQASFSVAFCIFLRHGYYMVWSYKITALLKSIVFVGAQLPPYSFHSQHRPHGNSREQKLYGGS